ncbi:MAG: MBL fold metallo-hydrolase [Bacteroidetes bacterium]|nr:MBL fold metallo-hydrolase [Bacteroidota bacterium]
MQSKTICLLAFFTVIQVSNSLLAQTNGWYTANEIGAKTWVIKEPGFDENMYLLEGQDSSLLIDAGFGMGNLRDFVKSLTSKPLIIVNTHFHPDHTGGDYEFPFVCIGVNDMEYAKPFLNPKVVQQITSQMLRDTTIADSLKFPESRVEKTILIPVSDNHLFKLGNRNVQVINVPGHTPGSIFLLDLKNKTLYTGDNMQTTWLFFKESLSVQTYMQSLKKLNKIKGKYNTLYPGHGKSLDIGILDELEQCCQQILSGRCEAKPYHSMIGQDGVSCTYKTVTIAYDPTKVK